MMMMTMMTEQDSNANEQIAKDQSEVTEGDGFGMSND
jgi:hypothetical protein